MTSTERLLWITALGAAVAAAVQIWVSSKLGEGVPSLGNGTRPPRSQTGSDWTNSGQNRNLQPSPDLLTYNGAGRQHNRTSANNVIYASKFHKGGNHNSPVNYEQSGAIQTSTKNPFANGTNNSYARAVNNATQDPTNQATALVLGPGIAPNDD